MSNTRLTSLQVWDVAVASVHLPYVKTSRDSESLKLSRETLAQLDAEWEKWTNRKRPPRSFVL